MQGQTMINQQVAFCQHVVQLSPASARRHTALPKTACVHKHLLKQRAQLRQPCQRPSASSQNNAPAASNGSVTSLSEAAMLPVSGEQGALPAAAGVYAVYDKDEKLQYIGLSRKVAVSIANHIQDLPQHTHSIKVATLSNPTKENLTAAWKQWVESAVQANGAVPPGNARNSPQQWVRKAPRAKPELKLTPGKGLQDLTCSVEDLLGAVVKTNKVVAFIKGTRTQPQCGFSYKVLTLLNEARADYEVVDVLDEQYNPGVREAIKNFSQWPTIPQLYVNGEFLGGADIVEEMSEKGELKQALQ